MRVYSTLDAIHRDDFSAGTAVAIGKFDGVHRGHQAILSALRKRAARNGLATVVFTFENNPLSVLRPEACPRPLASPKQRIDLLEAEQIDACVMVEFDRAFSEISAHDFVRELLVDKLHVKHVVLGVDFHFGHLGQGDGALLTELGEQYGFEVEIVAGVRDEDHGTVSSSQIREAVLAGDVVAAGAMLGRPYSVRGEVVHGDARGRELGFPTANLGGNLEGLVPADGVYAGAVMIEGVRRTAAISVGVNLTFEPEGEPRVEAFVLDFEDDLYGKPIEVQFTERIRSMQPFASVGALFEQMQNDVAVTRQIEAR